MSHQYKIFPANLVVLVLSLLGAPLAALAQEQSASPPPPAPTPQVNPEHSLPALSAGLPDVLKMLDAKVDSEIIKAYIQNSTMSFHPTAEELIMLKEHGASSDVLKALLEHRAIAPYVAPTTAPNAAQVAPTYANGAAYASMPAYDTSYPDYGYASYPSYAGYPYYYPYYYPYSSFWWPYFSIGFWPWCGGSFCFNHSHFHNGFVVHGNKGFVAHGNNGFVVHGNNGFHSSSGFVAQRGTSFNGHMSGFTARPAGFSSRPAGFAGSGGGGFAMHGGGGGGFHGGGGGGFHGGGGGGFHGGGGGGGHR
jgi:hypothetical protein